MVVPYSMFHIGCGGILIRDNKILLIQEKRVTFLSFRENKKGNSGFLEVALTMVKAWSKAQKDKSSSSSELKHNSRLFFGCAKSHHQSTMPLMSTTPASWKSTIKYHKIWKFVITRYKKPSGWTWKIIDNLPKRIVLVLNWNWTIIFAIYMKTATILPKIPINTVNDSTPLL